ncbi:hypothetical protein [Streptomyces sp. MB09-02B]|uniref:hypothetical protein n=1 Tax=Streptomyces sp. MB09-02B TaxID=3028667 RepID=UPI0029BF8035|nr:hypothetical protein [Streptomyces sp. MB09-02B]MDX3643093.1 hypothetical protein [Streptomyces sp. MB09-02B]
MPFIVWNSAAPTTAAQASVTTGTAIKTMLQIATPSTRQIQLLEWGFSLDDPPGADGVIELMQTDVAATVTAHVAAGIQNLDPNGVASLCVGGTSATGYTATVEGSTTATRTFDAVSLSSVSGESGLQYVRQWMPDARPIVPISKWLRVRATTPTTASDMRCWIVFQEVG